MDISDDSEKPDSSVDETKGVFVKYEMAKLNKYLVAVAIGIVNLASWLVIYQINYSWIAIFNPDLLMFGSIMLGIFVILFSAFFLYFNKKINVLLDERKKL